MLDLEKLLNSADVSGRILSGDPSGDYGRMDSLTRRQYLLRLERMARRLGMEEHILAQKLITRARQDGKHIGFYLYKKPCPLWSGLYIGFTLLLPLLLSLLIGFYLDSTTAALLLLIPLWELVKSFLDFLLLHLVSPRPLPRIDTSRGIPPEGKSLCVVSTILSPGQAERSCVWPAAAKERTCCSVCWQTFPPPKARARRRMSSCCARPGGRCVS